LKPQAAGTRRAFKRTRRVWGAGDEAVGKSALTQMFQSKGAVFPKNYKMVRPSPLLPSAVKCQRQKEYSKRRGALAEGDTASHEGCIAPNCGALRTHSVEPTSGRLHPETPSRQTLRTDLPHIDDWQGAADATERAHCGVSVGSCVRRLKQISRGSVGGGERRQRGWSWWWRQWLSRTQILQWSCTCLIAAARTSSASSSTPLCVLSTPPGKPSPPARRDILQAVRETVRWSGGSVGGIQTLNTGGSWVPSDASSVPSTPGVGTSRIARQTLAAVPHQRHTQRSAGVEVTDWRSPATLAYHAVGWHGDGDAGVRRHQPGVVQPLRQVA